LRCSFRVPPVSPWNFPPIQDGIFFEARALYVSSTFRPQRTLVLSPSFRPQSFSSNGLFLFFAPSCDQPLLPFLTSYRKASLQSFIQVDVSPLLSAKALHVFYRVIPFSTSFFFSPAAFFLGRSQPVSISDREGYVSFTQIFYPRPLFFLPRLPPLGQTPARPPPFFSPPEAITTLC